MPLVLDATVGGASSNAYLDEAAADALLAGVPNATAWTSLGAVPNATRVQALVYATQLLEALAYQGVKTTVAQALQWPRGAVTDPDYGPDASNIGYMQAGHWGVYLDLTKIPKRIQRATAMLALEILRAGTADIWGVERTANLQSEGLDVIRTEYVEPSKRRYGLKAFPSVWREVYPLTVTAQGRDAVRA